MTPKPDKDRSILVEEISNILYKKYRKHHEKVGACIDESKSDAEQILTLAEPYFRQVYESIDNMRGTDDEL